MPDSTRKVIKVLFLIGLTLWAAISMGRTIIQAISASGGNDLYTYWYAGHFLRENKDYYKSFINEELPAVPIQYLDREVESLNEVLFPGLVPAPASTAPVFFLLLPFAFLSWNTAKIAWLIINLLLIGVLPFLLVRLFDRQTWMNRWEFLALACALIGLTSTRYAAASGQLTFLLLDLMLAAILLAENRPWLAGIMLGMALSKYSLAFPILLLFVFFEPRIRLVIAAALTQLAGVIALMLLSGSGFFEIFNEYLQMALWHAGREGIHLAAALYTLTKGRFDSLLWPALVLTLLVAVPLAIWRCNKGPRGFFHPLTQLSRAHLTVILVLWALLAGYHRAYDVVAIILFFGLASYLSKHPAAWTIKAGNRTGALVFAGAALLLLMIPSGSLVRDLLPPALETVWGQAANLTATGLTIVSLVLSIFLLFRLPPERG